MKGKGMHVERGGEGRGREERRWDVCGEGGRGEEEKRRERRIGVGGECEYLSSNQT